MCHFILIFVSLLFMPKIKGRRINFRKQVSEPWLLKIIDILSQNNDENPLKSCYRLMQIGGKQFQRIENENKQNLEKKG